MNGDAPASALELHPAGAAPTRARYVVLAFLCSLAGILYLDRICINQAVPEIERELGISHTKMGWVFGAFLIAYGLFEVPTGRWGDRYGSRGVLTRIVLWWSAFTVLTGCIWKFTLDSGFEIGPLVGLGYVPLLFDSFMLLLLVRFLFGAGEAGALPNSARVVARWFPAGSRGPAQGMINTSALIGGAVAPVVAAYLIEKVVGWRWTFALFGLLGLVWAAAFYRWYRDDPAQHPAVNEAERQLIAAGPGLPQAASGEQTHPSVPWGRVLRSANVWLLGGVTTCSAFTSYLYFTWYPTYLVEARQMSKIQASWLSGLVLAGGAVGCTLGGFVGDAIVRRTGSRRWSRRLLGGGGLAAAAAALLASVHCDSPLAAASFTSLASLSAGTTLSNWWAVVTEISGKHLGTLFGLMNSMGVPGAFVSPLFLGRFVDVMKDRGYQGRDQWDPAFYVYASVLMLGAFGWLWIDATRSVVDPPRPLPEPDHPGP